jgi:hypothetical protein
MAEFNCFMATDEFINAMTTTITDGYRIALIKNYSKPQLSYCSNELDLRTQISEGQKGFMLLHNSESEASIVFRNLEKNGQKLWYPYLRESGLLFEAYHWQPYENSLGKFIPASLFASTSRVYQAEKKSTLQHHRVSKRNFLFSKKP